MPLYGHNLPYEFPAIKYVGGHMIVTGNSFFPPPLLHRSDLMLTQQDDGDLYKMSICLNGKPPDSGTVQRVEGLEGVKFKMGYSTIYQMGISALTGFYNKS